MVLSFEGVKTTIKKKEGKKGRKECNHRWFMTKGFLGDT